jgi:hypothetical protein
MWKKTALRKRPAKAYGAGGKPLLAFSRKPSAKFNVAATFGLVPEFFPVGQASPLRLSRYDVTALLDCKAICLAAGVLGGILYCQ